ncbi:hypothetical protein [Streptomyces albogriseolus]|uniref:MmyB family transcriptional regulator n=1 Tax=Streptomyces albogriseolus TaxID=1887 RepID=UPI003D723A4E
MNHPQVGELSLSLSKLDVDGPHGLALAAYHAAPGSEDAERLALLASLTTGPARRGTRPARTVVRSARKTVWTAPAPRPRISALFPPPPRSAAVRTETGRHSFLAAHPQQVPRRHPLVRVHARRRARERPRGRSRRPGRRPPRP